MNRLGKTGYQRVQPYIGMAMDWMVEYVYSLSLISSVVRSDIKLWKDVLSLFSCFLKNNLNNKKL